MFDDVRWESEHEFAPFHLGKLDLVRIFYPILQLVSENLDCRVAELELDGLEEACHL